MSTVIALVWLAIIILINVILVYLIIIPNILGAPFLRTKKAARARMLEFANIQPGDQMVDLGSGDGILLFESAKRGAIATGYEINPFLVAKTRSSAKKQGLEGKVEVFKKNFWGADLSGFDVVMLFGITHIMPKLEKKLRRELKPGSRVVSFTFKFPHWQPVRVEDNVYLYIQTDEK
jgi:cyclopropane fatty-acyl-phospholipid synthase-like methyltransferase